MMLRTSKFTNKNSLGIFGDEYKIVITKDPIECIIMNCDNVLRNILNVGFSNLDELPLECPAQQTQVDLIPLKPYYKMEVPGYKINDKRPTANVFNTQTNDGTNCVYYPNGQLAILSANAFGFLIEK